MRRLDALDWFMLAVCAIIAGFICFWIDTAARDYVASIRSRNAPVSRQEPRTRASTPVQVNIYVYRPQDVQAVLQAARKGLPELTGAEGVK